MSTDSVHLTVRASPRRTVSCCLSPLQRFAMFVIIATRGCRSIPRATQGHAATTVPGDPGEKGLAENGLRINFRPTHRTNKILSPTRFIRVTCVIYCIIRVAPDILYTVKH